MLVFKREINGKKSHDYYYSFQFEGKKYLRSTHVSNLKHAREIAEDFYNTLKTNFNRRKEAAKNLRCHPKDVIFCHQCDKPMREIGCVHLESGIHLCSIECRDKWNEAQEVVSIPTLREFQYPFMTSVETRSFEKPATIEFYRLKLDRLLEFYPLAESRLDKIDARLIDSYIQHRRRTVSPATVNRELATLRKALRLAYKWNLINRVPVIQLLPGERNRTFVLSPAQERDYLELAAQPLKDVALLLLDTGLRVSEALSLRWSDIHLEPLGAAHFSYLHVRAGKSKYAKRNLPLTPRVKEMLEVRYDVRRSNWVFTNETGTEPLTRFTIRDQHQKIKKALGLPNDCVIHSLRHTFGTRLGASGAGAFEIMKLMGHSNVRTSQKYVHPTPETLERAFERLQAYNESQRKALPAETGQNEQNQNKSDIKTLSLVGVA